MLNSLDMVEIRVRDWQGAVDWYQEKLALKVAAWDPDDKYCQLEPQGGGCRLGLWGVPSIGPGGRSRCLPPSNATSPVATKGSAPQTSPTARAT